MVMGTSKNYGSLNNSTIKQEARKNYSEKYSSPSLLT
jgi:hypothetical protein